MKNPWMSLWLSAFNRTAGYARAYGAAEAERQRRLIAAESMRQMLAFWTGGMAGAPPAKRRRGRGAGKR